ncbi:MAG TPA: DUF1844 domain-containing protein [Candidatus Binataceae bacterium]|nr:DUF1844 domain-containing protein [Candidatus Binataceae bacterium]
MNEREEEKSRGFKVQDRRRFSAEGEARPEVEAEAPRKPAAAPVTPAAGEAKPARGDQPGEEINFTAFVVSLSTQVLVHLGEMEDPLTNRGARDLPAARHLIDILGMLAEKTRGNLDGEEDALLRSILFDLRMKYVEATRHPAR